MTFWVCGRYNILNWTMWNPTYGATCLGGHGPASAIQSLVQTDFLWIFYFVTCLGFCIWAHNIITASSKENDAVYCAVLIPLNFHPDRTTLSDNGNYEHGKGGKEEEWKNRSERKMVSWENNYELKRKCCEMRSHRGIGWSQACIWSVHPHCCMRFGHSQWKFWHFPLNSILHAAFDSLASL